VFTCESGGGATAFGHPKELLVVRSNGSTAAYPAYEDGPLAAGDGEVVAGYNYEVVRVTSHGISVLLSYRELVGLVGDSYGVAGIIGLAVGPHGDLFVVARLYHHKYGCATTIAERAATGVLEKFWSATGQIYAADGYDAILTGGSRLLSHGHEQNTRIALPLTAHADQTAAVASEGDRVRCGECPRAAWSRKLGRPHHRLPPRN
jgi:hypothetical protein